MDWLIWLLFESLPALGVALGVALFILLVYWRRSGRGKPLLIGLGVALVLLITQKLVVTQREQARAILDAIERDLERGHSTVLVNALAPDFSTEGLDRESFTGLVQNRLGRVGIKYLSLTSLSTEESDSNQFTVVASYYADVVIDGFRTTLPSTWAITFERTPTGWQIRQIRCRALAGQANPKLSEIHGM
jgi:hypothetical protein